MTWFYRKIINPEEGEALAQVKRGHLAILPIIIPEQKNLSQWATYISLTELANQIHSLKLTKRAARTPTQVTMLEDQENALEDQIDQLVFTLYGLAVDEIELVTGKAARA